MFPARNRPLSILIADARVLAGDASADLCEQLGHLWKSEGGRCCPKFDEGINCSQTVYRCARCGDYDYGERAGPAWVECHQQCLAEFARCDEA